MLGLLAHAIAVDGAYVPGPDGQPSFCVGREIELRRRADLTVYWLRLGAALSRSARLARGRRRSSWRRPIRCRRWKRWQCSSGPP
jgi:hypothetical protein